MLGKARTTARGAQWTKADGKQDPEESVADRANQQEYDQLHAVGPAVNFAADAVEPLTPR
jgi:hypothetical protein